MVRSFRHFLARASSWFHRPTLDPVLDGLLTPRGRIPMEEAVSKIESDADKVRALHPSLARPRLSVRKMQFVTRFAVGARGRRYAHYDLAHHFIVRHLVHAAGEALRLTPDERRVVRAFLGRVYYNPPLREYGSMIVAGRALEASGRRGERIYAFLRSERLRLNGLLYGAWDARARSREFLPADTFVNTLYSAGWGSCESLGQAVARLVRLRDNSSEGDRFRIYD